MAGLATQGLAAEEAALLYERYEGRLYNVCYRILGYEGGAASATREAFLGMLRGVDPFAAVHAACHDLIEGPSVLREARSKGIRVANLTLPVDEREVLALRELEGLSHDEIAEIVGTDREAVAELISSARVRLRDSLSRTTRFLRRDCERALPLIALEQDGGLDADSNQAGWLDEHLMRCRACRAGRDAMQEATEAYRAWRPMAPGPQLFREAMTAAAEVAGTDWTRAIARHEAKRAAIESRRLRDVAAIGVLACLLLLVGLAAAIWRDDRAGSGAPPGEERAVPEKPAAREPGSAKPAAEAPAAAPRPQGKAPRTTAKKGDRPVRLERRRPERGGRARPERPRSERRRPERRRPERDRRAAAPPEVTPERQATQRQAQIELRPDPGGPESLVPEVAPAPAPPAPQPPQP